MSVDVIKRFNVRTVGQGAPTLVFAHGFGSDQLAWRHQVAEFSPRHQVVLFDHLGSGRADLGDYNPLHYDALARYADDVLSILDELKSQPVVFVGHSVSAMVGVLAALKRPEWFTALVLICGSPCYLNDGEYQGSFEPDDIHDLFRAMSDNYFAWANGLAPVVMANADRPHLGREFAASLSALRPDIAQSTARVIFGIDLRAELARVQHPTLVLQTVQDAFVPAAVGRYLAEHMANSRLAMLDAEGHVPHLSVPDDVNACLRRFFADCLA